MIVQCPRDCREAGESIYHAWVGTARQRFRPIVVTSMTLSSMVPLVLSFGAGRRGETFQATVLGIFFAPLLVATNT